jgi:superfamily II DNA or RNA helicase/PIN domain nuclease of toxin-antitoxin system
MREGYYEKIITQTLQRELEALDGYLVQRTPFGKSDGPVFIGRFFQSMIQRAFHQLAGERDELAKVKIIELANALIEVVSNHLDDSEFLNESIDLRGEILQACFKQAYFPHSNIDAHFKEVFPFTGLSESELFTGSKAGISLESELKKEMLTADEVWWLVSFIKFEGVRLFEQVLRKLEEEGKKVRIICTVYMGATDVKAIDFLSRFSNVEIRISYNTKHERLHAKSYLFIRNSGFHTGYIGSSNMSRSALTNGLEWNLKITQQEIPHIITKCRSTFETYWNDSNFEVYNSELHREKLIEALSAGHHKTSEETISKFFDIYPFPYQQEILDQLAYRRSLGENRNLVVAATGTGKTVMAAFDFKRFVKTNPQANFLFVAHREEILRQARFTFRQVLRNNDFGELWYGGQEPKSIRHAFVSIQTLNNRIDNLTVAPDFYDYIIIDEVHHSAANSYQKLLQAFSPQLLVGLTATPERHDGSDISRYFGHNISAEIRLAEALNRGLLCPFQYFGVTDQVDISRVSWRRGRYVVEELERLYSEDDRRVGDILRNCDKYLKDMHQVRALGFCVSKKHAVFMAEHFAAKGFRAAYLTSDNSEERKTIVQRLQTRQLNYLFVVDLFNEGVDIPEVDTLLFLRPTESLTIFLQQLGRGLRLHEDKDCLTVLDFVGQQHAEYSFEHKFRGMLGKTHTRVREEIENDFPHLPLGCSITLERTAKEVILQNITRSYRGGVQTLVKAIGRFKQEYTVPLTLRNFSEYSEIGLHKIYSSKVLFHKLVRKAEGEEIEQTPLQEQVAKLLGTTWLSTESASYFNFVQSYLSDKSCDYGFVEQQQMLTMFYVDLFDAAPSVDTHERITDALNELLQDEATVSEMQEYLALRLSQLTGVEKSFQSTIPCALRLHGRYTRNQILAGFSETKLNKLATSREGVYRIAHANTELLFVTLDKSDHKFNPTTMYLDYFISEQFFHWQSQNSTSPESPVGQSYINQTERKKVILLFVREATSDENGTRMAFVFCGPVHYVSHEGSKPMSITWRMSTPPPPELLNEGKKLAVG